MSAVKKLWEVEHDYYGPDGHDHEDHESWEAFLEEWIGFDLDYNYLYRWDWLEGLDNDVHDGEARLYLCFVQQRRGRLLSAHVTVTRADEPAIRAWLEGCWAHVRTSWAPLCRPEAPHSDE